MGSILQITVYLAKIEDFDGMNKVFKTYFPRGGPARTTVAVANLPGNSLVEINCIAPVTKEQGRNLGIRVNESKSVVARPQKRKFLGFSFTDGPEIKRAIAPKSLVRFKRRVREITRYRFSNP